MEGTEDHSVFGELDHSDLEALIDAASEVLPGSAITVYHSQFDGQKLLRLCHDDVALETDQGSADLFGGIAGTNLDSARTLLGRFSLVLTKRGIAHRFELYDRHQRLVQVFGARYR